MSLKPGDTVCYIARHHDVKEDELGRICKRSGATMFLAAFGVLGCVPVKATSLQKANGDAPECDGCP